MAIEWSILGRHLRENCKDQAVEVVIGKREERGGGGGGEHGLAFLGKKGR